MSYPDERKNAAATSGQDGRPRRPRRSDAHASVVKCSIGVRGAHQRTGTSFVSVTRSIDTTAASG